MKILSGTVTLGTDEMCVAEREYILAGLWGEIVLLSCCNIICLSLHNRLRQIQRHLVDSLLASKALMLNTSLYLVYNTTGKMREHTVGTFQVFPQGNLWKPDLLLWLQNFTLGSVAGYFPCL